MTSQAKTDSPEGDKTWAALCQALRISRPSITRWRKLPGAPAGTDRKEWEAFIAENDLGYGGARPSKALEELRKEKLEKENRLLDLKIAKEERTAVDREEVNQLLLHTASLLKITLSTALERELPAKAVGRTVEEIAVIGREFGDRVCDIFQRGVEQWRES